MDMEMWLELTGWSLEWRCKRGQTVEMEIELELGMEMAMELRITKCRECISSPAKVPTYK